MFCENYLHEDFDVVETFCAQTLPSESSRSLLLWRKQRQESLKRSNDNPGDRTFETRSTSTAKAGACRTRKSDVFCSRVGNFYRRLLLRVDGHCCTKTRLVVKKATVNLLVNKKFVVGFSDALGSPIKWADNGTVTICPINNLKVKLMM